jgi:hypothetical protein
LQVWGFGVWYQDVYLKRYEFGPRLPERPLSEIWHAEQLPPLHGVRDSHTWARALAAFTRVVGWIGAYETWVLSHCGPNYRERIIRAWRDHRKLDISAEAVPQAWATLAADCAHVLADLTHA